MTLIKSISGIRGTIGGSFGENLTPIDITLFTSAYAQFLKNLYKKDSLNIIIGRDARISGKMVSNLVVGTLQAMGVNVLDLGLSTTPTVEVAVAKEKADGGIILTASHNPKQWNALKLLNNKGEFISGKDGEELLKIADHKSFDYVDVDELGSYKEDHQYISKHIDDIISDKLVDIDIIKEANLTIAIDSVNSTGGISIPPLLKKLGVSNIIELYSEPNGHFPHNPEPLPENLTEISKVVKDKKANLGIVVDPDVDRLALVNEDGSMFGEEFTLVAVADYILKHRPGNTVSNLSSTIALKEVTEKYNQNYKASAVGEVNVVTQMKATNAVIGGEGNGGIIYPELHYGRDALMGIALFLTHYASEKKTMTELKATYPDYTISKNKIELTPQIDVDYILSEIEILFKNEEVLTIDGVKIIFANNNWVHLRKSNTEPIIRIYSEAKSKEDADKLAFDMIAKIKEIAKI